MKDGSNDVNVKSKVKSVITVCGGHPKTMNEVFEWTMTCPSEQLTIVDTAEQCKNALNFNMPDIIQAALLFNAVDARYKLDLS